MISTLLAVILASQAGPTAAEAAMLACTAKPDAERLACYDSIAARLADQTLARMQGPQASPAPQALGTPPAAPSGPMTSADIAAQAAAAATGAPLRAPGAASAPARPTASASARPAETEAAPRSDYGLIDRDRDAGEFKARIANVRFDARDSAVITLEDGQVWRQLSADNRKLRERDAERAEMAVIERGALGSYWLTVEPAGKRIKARRER